MSRQLLVKIQRILKMPFHIILQRSWQEFYIYIEKYTAPHKYKIWTIHSLLRETKANSLEQLWKHLGAQSYFLPINPHHVDLEKKLPENLAYILNAADNALQHKVDLLGTGLISLGSTIDWHKDYKTGKRWPQQFFKSIDYNNLDQPSDVKVPWEISRLQWLIPLGQAYLISKNEKYAEATKRILLSWIHDNPYAYSVNWACTMEVAIRIIVWSWLFHVFWQSRAWCDHSFQEQFLKTLFLHGDFTYHHLEKSSTNGNHYIADAAGLVFAGPIFPNSKRGKKWHGLGWKILTQEIIQQVSEDGVDYEGSIPYHRLVTEIFFYPALLRMRRGLEVSETYQQRLIKMADFVAHYTRSNGSVPLLGDADDGRIFVFGEQQINDHRYLIGLISIACQNTQLAGLFTGSPGEIYWVYGNDGIAFLNAHPKKILTSKAYKQGGYYIMRNEKDHIFIDCAPIGLKGIGGHGHNDCLSFEAMLDDSMLIVDSGSYVYTASPSERNYFRSTQAHNTPIVDDEEINRFHGPHILWTLQYDAKPLELSWHNTTTESIFEGKHSGYHKLLDPVDVTRKITLNSIKHLLTIKDYIHSKTKSHKIEIPFHLHPSINLDQLEANLFEIKSDDKIFYFYLSASNHFKVEVVETFYSTSYGKKTKNLCIKSSATLNKGFTHELFITQNLSILLPAVSRRRSYY